MDEEKSADSSTIITSDGSDNEALNDTSFGLHEFNRGCDIHLTESEDLLMKPLGPDVNPHDCLPSDILPNDYELYFSECQTIVIFYCIYSKFILM